MATAGAEEPQNFQQYMIEELSAMVERGEITLLAQQQIITRTALAPCLNMYYLYIVAVPTSDLDANHRPPCGTYIMHRYCYTAVEHMHEVSGHSAFGDDRVINHYTGTVWTSFLNSCRQEFLDRRNTTDPTGIQNPVWIKIPPSHDSDMTFFLTGITQPCVNIGTIGTTTQSLRVSSTSTPPLYLAANNEPGDDMEPQSAEDLNYPPPQHHRTPNDHT